VIGGKPPILVVRAVARIMIVRDFPESFEVVFIVRMKDGGSIIDRRIVKLCVVLGQFLMCQIHVKHEVIFWRCRVIIIDVFKAVFECFKLVKQSHKRD
jgi:hypothetical protein